MKRNMLKKVISVILAVCLVAPAALFASAVESETYPIIYLPENTDIVLYQQGSVSGGRISADVAVHDVNSKKFLSDITKLVMGFAISSQLTDEGAAQVNAAINQIFSGIYCNEKGEPANKNITPEIYNTPVYYNTQQPIYTKNIEALVKAAEGKVPADEIFVFNYDFRIDPFENAATLKDYIDKVLTTSGKSKVSIVACGNGGVVANTYLYAEPEHAQKNVSSCVFLDSAITGNSMISDVMSGDVVRTVQTVLEDPDDIFSTGKDIYDAITGADLGDALTRYIGQDPGGIINKVVSNLLGSSDYTSLVSLAAIKLFAEIAGTEGLFDMFGKGYKEIISSTDQIVYNGGLKEYLRNMPGLWAMVSENSYDKAIEFMFGDADSIPTDELRDKITVYRDVLNNTEKTLLAAQADGINVCIVAGYGMQMLPVTAHITEQSDGFAATRYAAPGARTTEIDGTIDTPLRCTIGNHNHMSPDKQVDAASCFLPENTWLIKNHEHMNYSSPTAAEFVVWLATGRSQRTVVTNEAYPQFMQKAVIGNKVYSYSSLSDTDPNEYMFGDLDVDGKVSASDARLALRYSVGLEGEPSRILLQVGDVNGSGQIDASDARLILRYSVGLDNGFSVSE